MNTESYNIWSIVIQSLTFITTIVWIVLTWKFYSKLIEKEERRDVLYFEEKIINRYKNKLRSIGRSPGQVQSFAQLVNEKGSHHIELLFDANLELNLESPGLTYNELDFMAMLSNVGINRTTTPSN